MADTANQRASTTAGAKQRASTPAGEKPTAEHGPPPAADQTDHAPPTCTVGFCPICLAVTAMQPLRPDVIEHLLVAGREFLLAARAVLDARAEQAGDGADGGTGEGRGGKRGRSRLEKIDIG